MKDELQKAREDIDRIDSQMAGLFEERMEAAERVALYKKKTGMQIFDPKREEEILERGSLRIKNEALRGYYTNFLRAEMDISKAYQSRILSGMRVAYSGVEGAFAQLASKKIFPDAAAIGYPDFDAAFAAVEKGECDAAVLPLENSTNGDVGKVMDLAFFGTLHISGIYDVEVVQNLLVKPGTSFSQIKTVVSHPQALGQCQAFLKENSLETREAVNTAVAAKLVAEGDDSTVAAIGSAAAAEVFGLEVLKSHINEKGGNTTRFAVFCPAVETPSEKDEHFVMVFTVKNEAGALAKAVSAIGECGFNLRAIKSRPTKNLSWEYYFFCEGDGRILSPEGEKMLKLLEENCNDLKVLGSYEKEIVIQ